MPDANWKKTKYRPIRRHLDSTLEDEASVDEVKQAYKALKREL